MGKPRKPSLYHPCNAVRTSAKIHSSFPTRQCSCTLQYSQDSACRPHAAAWQRVRISCHCGSTGRSLEGRASGIHICCGTFGWKLFLIFGNSACKFMKRCQNFGQWVSLTWEGPKASHFPGDTKGNLICLHIELQGARWQALVNIFLCKLMPCIQWYIVKMHSTSGPFNFPWCYEGTCIVRLVIVLRVRMAPRFDGGLEKDEVQPQPILLGQGMSRGIWLTSSTSPESAKNDSKKAGKRQPKDHGHQSCVDVDLSKWAPKSWPMHHLKTVTVCHCHNSTRKVCMLSSFAFQSQCNTYIHIHRSVEWESHLAINENRDP